MTSDQRQQTGRHVLVTGGTRGIGRAIAAELVAAGDTVWVGGRDEHVTQREAARLGAHPFVADLADEASVLAAVGQLPEIDVLVNNAGVVPPRTGTVRERLRATFEVNAIAVMDLTEHYLPVLRQRHGTVVFINSGAGLRAYGTDGYSASKWALTGYALALQDQEAGRVRVVSVHPGRVDTDMQRDLQDRQQHPYHAHEHMPPGEVARAVRAAIDAPPGVVWGTLTLRPEG